jgi:hypothetical protein
MDMTGGHMKKIREGYKDPFNEPDFEKYLTQLEDYYQSYLEDGYTQISAKKTSESSIDEDLIRDGIDPKQFWDWVDKDIDNNGINTTDDSNEDEWNTFGMFEIVDKALAQSRLQEDLGNKIAGFKRKSNLKKPIGSFELDTTYWSVYQNGDKFTVIGKTNGAQDETKIFTNKEKAISYAKGELKESINTTDKFDIKLRDGSKIEGVKFYSNGEWYKETETGGRNGKVPEGARVIKQGTEDKIKESGAYGGDAMSAEDGSSYINDRTEIEAKAKDLLSNEAYRAETGWNENELNEFLNSFTNEDIEHDYQAFVVGGLNEEKEPLYTQDIFEHPEASHVIDSNDQNVLERYFEEEQDGEDIPNLVGLTSLEAAKEIGPVDFEEETLQHIIVALNPDKFEPFY